MAKKPAAEPVNDIAGAEPLQTQEATGELVVRESSVPVDRMGDQFAMIAQTIGQTERRTLDNFPADKITSMKLRNAASTGKSVALLDIVGQEITIKYWQCATVEIDDVDTGEVNVCVRVVIFTHDGMIYHAVSGGIYQQLADLAMTFGLDSIPAELRFQVAQIKTRKGFRMLTLQIVD